MSKKLDFYSGPVLEKIRSHQSEPYTIEDFLSQKEIDQLLEEASGFSGSRDYGPGAMALRKFQCKTLSGVVKERVLSHFPGHQIRSSQINVRTRYVGIHTDNDNNPETVITKGILFPLLSYPSVTDHKVVFFRQRWDGPACRMDTSGQLHSVQFDENGVIKSYDMGSSSTTVYQRDLIRDYDSAVSDNPSFDGLRLSHLEPAQLERFSVERAFRWQPRTAIVFDRNQFHCSEDFVASRLLFKVGLMMTLSE